MREIEMRERERRDIGRQKEREEMREKEIERGGEKQGEREKERYRKKERKGERESLFFHMQAVLILWRSAGSDNVLYIMEGKTQNT